MASPKKRRSEVVDLLLELRAQGIRCSTVTVGGVTLEGVVDTKMAADGKPEKPEPRVSMWNAAAEAIQRTPANAKDAVPEEALLDG